MNKPSFTLDQIKHKIDEKTFKKGAALYQARKVTDVDERLGSYAGIVHGTQPYNVSVESRNLRYAHCTCYLGQNDTYCKHMVALALYAVSDGKPLTEQELKQVHTPTCSSDIREPDKDELSKYNKEISAAIRYIKPYTGPSRTWWANQDSLQEGCNRLSETISRLPIHWSTADLIVKTLVRIDKKLISGSIDDSNGIIGGFITDAVQVLIEFARHDTDCTGVYKQLDGVETCFGWEEPLLELV